MPSARLAAVASLVGLFVVTPVEGADAVVGPPCNEAAFDVALAAVQGSGGGRVTFNCGVAVIPITEVKSIDANVTVDGGGQVTLSGGGASPLFYVDVPGRLALDGITLAEAYNPFFDGGAVHNDGLLVVANSTFRNNRTTAAGSGGAIVSYGPVEITDSLFEGNQAANGGALYLRFAAAQATIRNTVFRNNSTLSSTDGWGGAILTWDGATATVEGGQMYGNTATGGGAIYNSAFADVSDLVLIGAWIHHNQAALQGGGVYSSGVLTMFASVVDSNSAMLYGGGLYLTGIPQVLLTTSLITGGAITGNSAALGGGVYLAPGHVALNLAGTNVRGNTASANGGGFYNDFSRLNLDGGRVQANTAGSSGGGVFAIGDPGLVNTDVRLVDLSGNSATAYGGGIYQSGGILRLDRSTVSHNVAGLGGGAYANGSLEVFASTLNGNAATSGGGGVFVYQLGRAVLRNSTLNGNTAVDRGGAVSSSGPLVLENVTISGNASPLGGGLFVDATSSATLENTIVANSPQGGDCSGPIVSSKYSIAGDNTCGLVGPGDRNATDPKLTPLGHYGGPTLVHMLATGSPAIDGVFGSDAPPSDQRGIGRPQGVGFDIGAVERTPTDTDQPIDLIFADGFEA